MLKEKKMFWKGAMIVSLLFALSLKPTGADEYDPELSSTDIVVDLIKGPNGLESPQKLENFWGNISYESFYGGTMLDELAFSGGGVSFRNHKKWRSYTVKNTESKPGARDGLSNDSVMSIGIEQNYKWFGTFFGGLNRFDGRNWINYTEENTGTVGFVTELTPTTLTDDSADWIPDQFKGLVLKFSGRNFVIESNTFNTLKISSTQGLLNDLTAFGGKPGDRYLILSGLGSNNVMAAFIDSQGNKWFGTGGVISLNNRYDSEGGVSKYDGISWENYTAGNTDGGLGCNIVISIAEDKNGDMWFGTGSTGQGYMLPPYTGGGITQFDGGTWKNYELNSISGLFSPSNTVTAIAIDHSGNRWFGLNDFAGVYDFEGAPGGVLELPEDGNPANPSDWLTFTTSSDGLVDDLIFSIAVDSQGNKWFATSGGVSMLNDKGTIEKSDDIWTNYTSDYQKGRYIGGGNSGLADNIVFRVAIDSDGNKWFGTSSGLSRFDGNTWRTYTTKNGLVDNKINSIVFEPDGEMWLGTGDYISTWSGKRTIELIRDANERRRKSVFKHARMYGLFSDNPRRHVLSWDTFPFIYTEEFYHSGDPRDLNWDRVDQVFDKLVWETWLTPVVPITYIPQILASDPSKFLWWNGTNISPPNDYNKWGKLVYETLKHFVKRYGPKKVKNWYFEVFSEPDFFGFPSQEYHKLFDYTVEAAQLIEEEYDVNLKVGGPVIAGARDYFLDEFLSHVTSEENYVTGEIGTELDFVNFSHRYHRVDHVLDKLTYLVEALLIYDPKYRNIEKLSGETAPKYDDPVHNTTYAAAWQCKFVDGLTYFLDTKGIYYKVVSTGYFHTVPAFMGTFNECFGITANIGNAAVVKRPVFNAFEALSYLGNRRVSLEGTNFGDYIHGIATKDRDGSVSVLLYHLDEEDIYNTDRGFNLINLTIKDLPHKRYFLKHFKIDKTHSNAYTKWLGIGSPSNPTAKQVNYLKKHDDLELAEPIRIQRIEDKTFSKEILLQSNSVDLLVLKPIKGSRGVLGSLIKGHYDKSQGKSGKGAH